MRPNYRFGPGRPVPRVPARFLSWLLLSCSAAAPGAAGAQQLPPPLTEAQVDSARAIIAAFKADDRGPYLRIRWFCNDGRIEPPQGSPCRERGGGHQHAEMKPEAVRLGRMGLHVGTILQGLEFEAFRDASRANDRLKQIVLEAHLVGVDDGWVLRRARYYRGARQAEDEEIAGTRLLAQLLADTAWTARNFWVAGRTVAVVPHIGDQGDQLVHTIRNLASAIADVEPAFLPLRVRIHSFPSAADLADVAAWRRRPNLGSTARARLDELHAALEAYYDQASQLENLSRLERRFAGDSAIATRIREVRSRLAEGSAEPSLRALAGLSRTIREHVARSRSGAANLRLIDLNLAVQDHAVRLGSNLAAGSDEMTRGERIASLEPLFDLAYGAGLLSWRERTALHDRAGSLMARGTLGALEYRQELAYLARALDWSTRTIRSSMSPALERYEEVEPRTLTFADAVTRGSVLLPMSRILGQLAQDADDMLGTSHVVFDQSVRTGLRGLNPGMAIGPLRRAKHEDLASLDRDGIYILPETAAELRPVKGVLSLDAGNLLSHVQLLARNLGIPNASLASSVLPTLEAREGRIVLYAVTPLGRVVVQDTAVAQGAARSLLDPAATAVEQKLLLGGERIRLDVTRPVGLGELRSKHSGVLVGPKAANLGQLAHVFPERVAPGLALPFGMFLRHVDRPHLGMRPLDRLARAYEEAARMRAAGVVADSIDAHVFEALAAVRGAIEELPWVEDMRGAIVEAVDDAFAGDLSAGIFVRSDTNVEDLPQFSGAGLNLTVPNQRTIDGILAAVKRVWTSPFSERAYLWRRQILDERSVVYPSVLLLQTVASEHSGVLISSGLQYGDETDLTIAAAEGIGGAVDGEDAETIVARADGSITLLSQTKAPRRRILGPEGGLETVPARRPEMLMSESEIDQLRHIVASWKAQTTESSPDRIWDMEFGVVDGYVWLFQVRPFIRFRSSQLLDRLSILDEETMQNADRAVVLDERP